LNLLGNTNYLVKGLSSIKVTVPSASKATAQKSASMSSYDVSFDTLKRSMSYSSSADVSVALGVPVNAGSKSLIVTAKDSRGYTATQSKTLTVLDYAKPVIQGSTSRENNWEDTTTLAVSGTLSPLKVGSVQKNKIVSAKYRYKKSGGSWSSWVTMAVTNSGSKL